MSTAQSQSTGASTQPPRTIGIPEVRAWYLEVKALTSEDPKLGDLHNELHSEYMTNEANLEENKRLPHHQHLLFDLDGTLPLHEWIRDLKSSLAIASDKGLHPHLIHPSATITCVSTKNTENDSFSLFAGLVGLLRTEGEVFLEKDGTPTRVCVKHSAGDDVWEFVPINEEAGSSPSDVRVLVLR